MFYNLKLSDWSALAAIVAFVVSAGIFLWIVIETIRCPRKKIEHLENMPFTGEDRNK